ncbi:Outer membrane protein beta-barrel domain-containing protein [Tenacibaculum sp. MAR_2009_124]|uniref:porin family protein n=1 Tax=Tenacibaculum sp. MAR_2009_124 TaxID=1250059 RepID=UPI00089A5DDD|nr:porin family protein [Tenacibaculum sp. MAR_2009_124]SEB42905.1 Outer membrane protein beta-barrel domain-containing protein [Tenacibaculum sp. MAR_2009_124]
MKKLLFAVFMILGLTVNAQNIEFGAKAGLSLSNLSVENSFGAQSFDSSTNFHFGGVVEFKLSEKFSIQPELLFSRQGNVVILKGGNGIAITDFEETTRLDYLNIPVMVKYYFIKNFSVEVGPQIGVLLSAKSILEDKSVTGNGDEKNDIKEYIESLDYGVNFGVGYKLDNGINFGLRYNLGLSDIVISENNTLKNRAFQISLGYNF